MMAVCVCARSGYFQFLSTVLYELNFIRRNVAEESMCKTSHNNEAMSTECSCDKGETVKPAAHFLLFFLQPFTLKGT